MLKLTITGAKSYVGVWRANQPLLDQVLYRGRSVTFWGWQLHVVLGDGAAVQVQTGATSRPAGAPGQLVRLDMGELAG